MASFRSDSLAVDARCGVSCVGRSFAVHSSVATDRFMRGCSPTGESAYSWSPSSDATARFVARLAPSTPSSHPIPVPRSRAGRAPRVRSDRTIGPRRETGRSAPRQKASTVARRSRRSARRWTSGRRTSTTAGSETRQVHQCTTLASGRARRARTGSRSSTGRRLRITKTARVRSPAP